MLTVHRVADICSVSLDRRLLLGSCYGRGKYSGQVFVCIAQWANLRRCSRFRSKGWEPTLASGRLAWWSNGFLQSSRSRVLGPLSCHTPAYRTDETFRWLLFYLPWSHWIVSRRLCKFARDIIAIRTRADQLVLGTTFNFFFAHSLLAGLITKWPAFKRSGHFL